MVMEIFFLKQIDYELIMSEEDFSIINKLITNQTKFLIFKKRSTKKTSYCKS